jgi:hypothetical protein
MGAADDANRAGQVNRRASLRRDRRRGRDLMIRAKRTSRRPPATLPDWVRSPLVDVEPMWKALYEVREREGEKIFRDVVREVARRLGELHRSKA